MNIAVVLIATLTLVGCAEPYLESAARRSDVTTNSPMVCVDGVEYMFFKNAYGSSMTAHLKTDGKPYTC